ncbi:hypothetical protein C8R42DRAFT_649793 [Lentinula raphanica]|nr:hypothetical protein C8R42DRAFT_649793 [Lentinula raphanica]
MSTASVILPLLLCLHHLDTRRQAWVSQTLLSSQLTCLLLEPFFLYCCIYTTCNSRCYPCVYITLVPGYILVIMRSYNHQQTPSPSIGKALLAVVLVAVPHPCQTRLKPDHSKPATRSDWVPVPGLSGAGVCWVPGRVSLRGTRPDPRHTLDI